MSYVPTEWETGDIVTADKLNKLEIGVARGNGIVPSDVNSETDEITIDRSFDELTEMIASGTLPFLVTESNNGLVLAPLINLVYINNCYVAVFGDHSDVTPFYSLYSDTQMSTVQPIPSESPK